MWDIPGVCHYLDDEFVDFFDALSQTENFNYFALEPVKKLIDLNYPLVKKYSVYKLLIPFVFFMMAYFFYYFVCVENERVDPAGWTLITDIMSVIVVLFASYFFKNEVTELYHEGLNYFTSFWNYIDICPALGIYTLFLIRIADKFFSATNQVDPNNPSEAELSVLKDRLDGPTMRLLLALTTWLMWFKFLYFFRLLKETGYLIRMIMEVISDMRNFILVMLITLFAFGNATLVLVQGYPSEIFDDEGNGSDPRFITSWIGCVMYTYELILGAFDTSKFL